MNIHAGKIQMLPATLPAAEAKQTAVSITTTSSCSLTCKLFQRYRVLQATAKAAITIAIRLRFNFDLASIRLRRSYQNYDSASIQLQRKMNMWIGLHPSIADVGIALSPTSEQNVVWHEFMPSLTYCHNAHLATFSDESNRSRIIILITIVLVES